MLMVVLCDLVALWKLVLCVGRLTDVFAEKQMHVLVIQIKLSFAVSKYVIPSDVS